MKTKPALIAFFVLRTVIASAGQDIQYYAVLIDGSKVGYATRDRVVEAGQVRTTEQFDMTIQRMGIEMNVKTAETFVETVKGEPLSFTSVQDMGMVTVKTEGTVSPDGTTRVKTSGAGEARETDFPWPQGALMPEGLRLLQRQKGLKQGTAYSARVFVPGMLGAIETSETVGGKEEIDLFGRFVTLTRIESTMTMPGAGRMTSVSFVDDQFRQLKIRLPMIGVMVDMIACEKQVAMSGNRGFDFGDNMFVSGPGPIEAAETARSITYVLRPVKPGEDLVIPACDNQKVSKSEDGSIIVAVEPAAVPKGGTFPYRGDDKELMGAIKPTRFLQSDDAKIKELAGQAIGDTKDSGEAAKKIEAFVAGYVDNISLSVGYASAAEVALSRKGDCSEFAVLCAAMCRAVGIPARVVVGIAYAKNFVGKTGFGGHAWVEANIGGKWVGLDPAFKKAGWGGYDAGHIALARGDGEPIQFFNLATTMGRFKIEKITVEEGR